MTVSARTLAAPPWPQTERCAFCSRPASRVYAGPVIWLRGTQLCSTHADQATAKVSRRAKDLECDRTEIEE